MPLQGQTLVIEPRFLMARELSEIGRPASEDPLPDGVSERNSWWSDRLRGNIIIWNEGGRVLHAVLPQFNSLGFVLGTLGCADAWGIEQEARAIKLLGELISHRAFKQYMLTGMFLETSRRSGLTYLFRRLRPTVAIDARNPEGLSLRYRIGAIAGEWSNKSRVLCALCMHPIAYYADTWAGAMTPTDDVIAHLMLMRGDEAMFWRRANQHGPTRPQAGL